MKYLIVFAIVLAIIALCVLGLGIQTFFSKKKKFPEYEVGENQEMRKRGILCMHAQQKIIDAKIKQQNATKIDNECEGCALLGTINCNKSN